MNNIDNLIILFDYYGELLTNKQKEYFKEYYFDNLTLSEIAENNEISKNAVSKELKLVSEKLLDFENKLNIYSKDKRIKRIIDKIEDNDIKQQINNILDE
jgi:predicted DNA-binding protein YlxM (UPF0122 family)